MNRYFPCSNLENSFALLPTDDSSLMCFYSISWRRYGKNDFVVYQQDFYYFAIYFSSIEVSTIKSSKLARCILKLHFFTDRTEAIFCIYTKTNLSLKLLSKYLVQFRVFKIFLQWILFECCYCSFLKYVARWKSL